VAGRGAGSDGGGETARRLGSVESDSEERRGGGQSAAAARAGQGRAEVSNCHWRRCHYRTCPTRGRRWKVAAALVALALYIRRSAHHHQRRQAQHRASFRRDVIPPASPLHQVRLLRISRRTRGTLPRFVRGGGVAPSLRPVFHVDSVRHCALPPLASSVPSATLGRVAMFYILSPLVARRGVRSRRSRNTRA
jgi:hypothetical protein